MLVYRVAQARWAKDLSGEGSSLFGGRWNSRGNAMIYTSSTPSLALLEILAHSSIAPIEQTLVTFDIPSKSIHKIAPKHLPEGWDKIPPGLPSQQFGDNFLSMGKWMAMRVPSVILPMEENMLINPNHPLTRNMKIVHVQSLSVDPRLLGRN